jgi:DNA-directed RNA polymerase subunit RPC12/RpoP
VRIYVCPKCRQPIPQGFGSGGERAGCPGCGYGIFGVPIDVKPVLPIEEAIALGQKVVDEREREQREWFASLGTESQDS